ncbi:hypothetical protein [Turneriella parva]|uniref:Uncharacterized protein n=1 Tax=Turneriella parva (strain ATCC BAA-1111 / DSM 21527 / NCTC 11395 / H) TaxID=869212 RepID=I4B957_TURPD|nr:hypothetical protein [Turneriella parva]AFM13814.1 hypothetical protein Turpa_3175 [Turneriella parva DSM 21527]
MRFSPRVFGLLIATVALSAETGDAQLVVVTATGRIAAETRAFLMRRFSPIELKAQKPEPFYREKPQLPTPVCAESSWYLFSPTGSLAGHGCISDKRPAEAEREIRRAYVGVLAQRRPQRSANSEAIEAVIADAAAGLLPEARAKLKEIEGRQLSAEEQKLVRRLRLYLGRAR